MRKRYQNGQALVIVLLSLSVVLTLVLFILSRSITDIASSSRDEESVRAFSAAEAGIEQALVIGSSVGYTTLSDSSYSASVTSIGEGSTQFNYPVSLWSGDTATFWFVAHDETGATICSVDKPCFTGDSVKVCWGRSGTSASSATTPAIEASIFYNSTPDDYSTAEIARVTLDPHTSRANSTNFTQANTNGCTIDEQTYQFHSTISLPAGDLQFMRIRALYNSDEKQIFGIDGISDIFPAQGMLINSSGVSGESNRRIEVFQGWSSAPSVFDFAVFSPTGLTK